MRLTDRAVALLGEQEESRDLPRLRMHYAWVLLNQASPARRRGPRPARPSRRGPGTRRRPGSTSAPAATLRGRAYLLLGRVDDAAEQAAAALQLLGPSVHVERVPPCSSSATSARPSSNMDLAQESYERGRASPRP